MNQSNAIHVPTRLLGTPLMVSQAEAEMIMAALRGALGAAALRQAIAKPLVAVNGVVVIPILGGLTYRGYGWWGQTYGDIRKACRSAMADEKVNSIVFDIDSPGGEVAGVFDLVDEIYQARSSGKKKIVAVANEDCFSAAYAIASAAEKIYLPRTGRVGSIGVIAIHYEQSRAEERAGIKYTSIFSGARKDDFSMHAPLSKEAYQIALDSVNRAYDLFLQTVSRNRGVFSENLRVHQSGIFEGSDAVTARLADGVKTIEEVISELSSDSWPSFSLLGNGAGSKTNKSAAQDFAQVKQGRVDRVGAQLTALLADPAKRPDAIGRLLELGFEPADGGISKMDAEANAERKSMQAETDRAVAIAEKTVLAWATEIAAALIEEGVSAEDAGRRIAEYKHANDPSAGINNCVSCFGPSAGDYLIADAKRRAKELDQKKAQVDQPG